MSLGLTSVNIIRTVDRAAIDSVRDQIFNNAQQKAALVAKNDVMNEARASFRQNSNPFSSLNIAGANQDASSSSSSGLDYSSNKQDSKQKEDVKKISLKHRIDQENIMLQARKQIGGSAGLMQKLNFMQTQAAISAYSARA